MSLPDAVRKPSLTGEPTAPFQSQGAGPGPPVDQIRVALVPRSGLQPVEEIQRLLRRRLRFFALVIAGGLAVLLLVLLLPAENGSTLGVYFAVFAVAAVAAGILWSPRPL